MRIADDTHQYCRDDTTQRGNGEHDQSHCHLKQLFEQCWRKKTERGTRPRQSQLTKLWLVKVVNRCEYFTFILPERSLLSKGCVTNGISGAWCQVINRRRSRASNGKQLLCSLYRIVPSLLIFVFQNLATHSSIPKQNPIKATIHWMLRKAFSFKQKTKDDEKRYQLT